MPTVNPFLLLYAEEKRDSFFKTNGQNPISDESQYFHFVFMAPRKNILGDTCRQNVSSSLFLHSREGEVINLKVGSPKRRRSIGNAQSSDLELPSRPGHLYSIRAQK